MPEYRCNYRGCEYKGKYPVDVKIHQTLKKHTLLTDSQEAELQGAATYMEQDVEMLDGDPELVGDTESNGECIADRVDVIDEEPLEQSDQCHHPGRIVQLAPTLHSPALCDSDPSSDSSSVNSDSDSDDDQAAAAALAPEQLSLAEHKLLPVLLRLSEPQQHIVLQTITDASFKPSDVRWNSGAAF